MLNLQALITPYAMPNPTAAVQGASQSLGDVADFKEGRRKDIQHQAQQQGEFDQTHALQQQEQDYSEHKDTRDYNQKREDEYNALDKAYRHAQAQDPKQADEIYGPIFKDRGYAERRNPSPEAAPGEDIKRDVPVGEPKPIPVEPAPTSPSNGALPGESASSYMARRQATPEEPEAKPEPVEPKNEDEALAQLEAAQKEAELKQAAPEAAPAEGVPSAAQMTAPPPKTAAPMDAKPADVAPAQAAPPAGMVQTGSSTRTKGMTGETPEGPGPEVGPLAKDQPALESSGFEMRSPMGRQAHFGAQPGQGQEAQRQLQQDAYAFVSKIPDPKIRAIAGAWLSGGVVNGDIRTPAQLAHVQDQILKLMENATTADATRFSALHRPSPGAGRSEVLDYEPGRKSVMADESRPGQKESFAQYPTINVVEKALTSGKGGVMDAAAVRFAAKLMNSGVLTDKDAEAPFNYENIATKIRAAFTKGVDAQLEPEERESLLGFIKLKKETIESEAQAAYQGQLDAGREASMMPGTSAYARGMGRGMREVFGKFPFYKQGEVDSVTNGHGARGSGGAPDKPKTPKDAKIDGLLGKMQ